MAERQCRSLKNDVRCQGVKGHKDKHYAWVNGKLMQWLVGHK